MPLEVSVTTDPLIVYAVVALLLGSVVAALVFSRPRRGLGGARSSDTRATPGSGLPWMPGTDILGRPEQSPPPSSVAAVAPLEQAAAPSAPSASPAPLPPQAGPPSVHDPWSTGTPGQAPRWDKR